MADLDDAIYPVLVRIARQNETVSYSELCDLLPGRWAGMSCRSRLFHAALGALVERCRAVGLPALSALVINRVKWRPGDGYFRIAHPQIDDDAKRMIAWHAECTAAYASNYPASIP